MFKSSLSILLILITTLPGFAQVFTEEDQAQIDSLSTVLKRPETPAVDRAFATITLAEILYVSDMDTFKILSEEALRISKKELESTQGDSVSAVLLKVQAASLNDIGYWHLQNGEWAIALSYYNRAKPISEELNDRYEISVYHSNIAEVYRNLGDIKSALEHHMACLKIEEELGDQKGIANSLRNLGMIYDDQGDLEAAEKVYQRALIIERRIGARRGEATTLNNLAFLENIRGNYQGAIQYYEEAIKLARKIGYVKGEMRCLGNLGATYRNLKNYSKALEYYKISLALADSTGSKIDIATGLNGISNITRKMGNHEEARELGVKALKLAQELGVPRLISSSAGNLKKVYQGMAILARESDKKSELFKSALEMYELHIIMRDSIKNEETQKESIRQQTKYEFEKAQLVKEQEEIEAGRLEQGATSRRDNLQYSVILIAILALFGGVLALGFINVSERMTEGIIFFSFLILFEFVLVLADPYIDRWSGGAPGIKLLFNAGIAALIFPAHAFFEAKLKGRLVNK